MVVGLPVPEEVEEADQTADTTEQPGEAQQVGQQEAPAEEPELMLPVWPVVPEAQMVVPMA